MKSVVVMEERALDKQPNEHEKQGDSATLLAVIECLRANPGQFVGEIAEVVGVSESAVSKHLRKLSDQGLVQFQSMIVGRGNPRKIPGFTPLGVEKFGPPDMQGCKCGPLGFRWLKIAESKYLEALPENCLIELEFFVNHRESVDLAVICKGDPLLALEIELQSDLKHCVDNIEKALVRGRLKMVVSAYPTQKKKEQAEREAATRLTPEQLQQVRFAVLPEYLA